jgi:hypothetical protein
MAVGLHGNYMAVACRDEVVVLQNDRDLARTYPKKPDTYDALYTPRASYWCVFWIFTDSSGVLTASGRLIPPFHASVL